MTYSYVNGAMVLLYFNYKDSKPGTDPLFANHIGLLHYNGTPKMAYYAYKQFLGKVRESRFVEAVRSPKYAEVYRYDNGIYVAWANKSKNYDLSSLFQSANIRMERIATSDAIQTLTVNSTRVRLTNTPVYLISNDQ